MWMLKTLAALILTRPSQGRKERNNGKKQIKKGEQLVDFECDSNMDTEEMTR